MSDEQTAWNEAFAPRKLVKVDANEYEIAYNNLFKTMIQKEPKNDGNTEN